MRKLSFLLILSLFACSSPDYDVVIKNGTVYDGSLSEGVKTDLAIKGDRIVKMGDLSEASATNVIDASGKAVAPGFINMLSWATRSLIHDGKSQSDIRQGVTLEVFGEGWSMGPWNKEMIKRHEESQDEIVYDVEWSTLGGYLTYLEEKGVSPNVASMVGATTLRIHQIGQEDRPPTEAELDSMRLLVDQAMREGALGVGSSLIYAPAFYAKTEELIALCEVAARYGGIYTTHLRSEGNKLLQAIDELIQIVEATGIRGEIYHLKAAGKNNHDKLDLVIAKIDSARQAGLDIAADMYLYVAGATGLNATMPPWVQEGGYDAWAERLRDPETRAKVAAEMVQDSDDWENFFYGSGADGILLSSFRTEKLRPYVGKTLAEVAEMRGQSPEQTAIDLVLEDSSRVEAVFFLMSEENVKRQIKLPYMTFCSDAGSMAPEGIFLQSSPHPRAYGNFARLLGKYVREEQVIPLHEAIHKLTGLSADKLNLTERGYLRQGYFADVVVFDPAMIQDHATFEQPHQYSTGVQHVFVNGKQVLKDGEHTGALPGRFVKGPGYKGNSQ